MLPPANHSSAPGLYVDGPQGLYGDQTGFYGQATVCDRRAYHRVRAVSEDDAACEDCGLHGNRAWARKELRAQEDFLMILGQEIIDLGNRELRQRAQFRKAMDNVR